MKRAEVLAAVAAAYLMATAGVVWEFGSYGLMSAGGFALLIMLFVKTEE